MNKAVQEIVADLRKADMLGTCIDAGAIADQFKGALDHVLTRLRFWEDDARTFTKSTGKFWGPKPYLAIAIKTEAELYNMGGGNG